MERESKSKDKRKRKDKKGKANQRMVGANPYGPASAVPAGRHSHLPKGARKQIYARKGKGKVNQRRKRKGQRVCR